MAFVAGALMAALVPGVASAEKGGLPGENGCSFPVGAYISMQAKRDGSVAGPNNGAQFPWVNPNRYYVPEEGVPDAPGQNIKWRCIVYELPA